MAGKKIAVVRVRGKVDVAGRLNDTMRMMGLTRVNHCSFVNENQIGMIRLCKDYLTWGEVDKETMGALIMKRGMKIGNKRITPDDVSKAGFQSIDDFVSKFFNSETDFAKLGIKKVFRLHPPRKGHGHIKLVYPEGGLGNRKGEMSELLKRMM
ncbi:MAG: 50S ribosomal protein L30 [Candidatus Micrarchaeota archaeon]